MYQGQTEIYSVGDDGGCEFSWTSSSDGQQSSVYFRSPITFYDKDKNVLKAIKVETVGEIIYGPYRDEFVGYLDGTSDIDSNLVGCRFYGYIDLPYSEFYYWGFNSDESLIIGPYSQDDFKEDRLRGFGLWFQP